MSDNTYYTQLNVSLIESLEKRIAELEQKWIDQETEISVGCTKLATKDWVDYEVSRRLRNYKEK